MNKVLTVSLVIAALAFAGSAASAQTTEEAARASLVPFYKALNAVNAKDSPELIRQSTTPEWVTCRGNDLCNTRDEVMAGVGQRLKAISRSEMGDQGGFGVRQSRHRTRRGDRHSGR
jgi:hypothetical protein